MRYTPRKGFRYIKRNLKKVFLYKAMLTLLRKRRMIIDRDYNVESLRKMNLQFVESMRIKDGIYGKYRHSPFHESAILYSSVCAALVRHLFGDLDQLSVPVKQQWINYINSYQGKDGLFRDPMITNPLADTVDWWGWRHLTLHSIMALSALGGTTMEPFTFLTPYLNPDKLISWLNGQNWDQPSPTSNAVQNIGVFLQYARDYHNNAAAARASECFFDWLDRNQDPLTGSWGRFRSTRQGVSDAVQTGYHIWLLYFYDCRPFAHVERIIDYALSTQSSLGGYGVEPNSTACADIDSIDPLARLMQITDYRKAEIQTSLTRALPWVLTNLNEDGGYVFLRDQEMFFGHKLTSYKKNESAMFPTWFRTLSLAYLAQALPNEDLIRFNWQFLKCPGHQFWNGKA